MAVAGISTVGTFSSLRSVIPVIAHTSHQALTKHCPVTHLPKPECERPVPCGLVADTLPLFLPESEKKAPIPLLLPVGTDDDAPLLGSAPDPDDSFLPRSPSRKLGRRSTAPPPPASLPPEPCRPMTALCCCCGCCPLLLPAEPAERADPTEEMEACEVETPSSSLAPPLLRPRLSPAILCATPPGPCPLLLAPTLGPSSSSQCAQWSSCTGASSFRQPTASFTSCAEHAWTWQGEGRGVD